MSDLSFEIAKEQSLRIAELEAQLQALREAVEQLAKIAPQNNARAMILATLEKSE